MSFQAYIDNIKTKTGKTPEDFRKIAESKGLLKPLGNPASQWRLAELLFEGRRLNGPR